MLNNGVISKMLSFLRDHESVYDAQLGGSKAMGFDGEGSDTDITLLVSSVHEFLSEFDLPFSDCGEYPDQDADFTAIRLAANYNLLIFSDEAEYLAVQLGVKVAVLKGLREKEQRYKLFAALRQLCKNPCNGEKA